MIIDSLTHITSDGKWFNTNHVCSLSRLTKMIETYSIEKSILCGMPVTDDSETILKAVGAYPDKFLAVAGFHPVGKSAAEIEEEIKSIAKKGFIGIKIHPRLSKLKLDSEEVLCAIKKAGEYGLVSFICTINRPPAQPLNRPLYDAIHYLCAESISSKIVLLHGGYYELLSVSEIVRPFEHVFLDLSTTLIRFIDTSLREDIKFLIKTFDKRIVFGSDFPEYSYGDVLDSLKILGFERKWLENQGVLGDNFMKFIEQ
ncbi:MAG: amidohydrolase family protein [Bacteroidetes bacterium]|nr:amidohydrolase family protein [Bacteroidota bacterium]